jgi:integrase
LLPTWGALSLADVKTVEFESWLETLKLKDGSRAKVRNIMSAIYSHGMRWEFTDRNPISLVRQSAKRQKVPCVLNVEELRALLAELTGMYFVMVFVAATTGLRISELLALRWQDCDFAAGEIVLTRGIVRQRETMMKTEASRKPVPLVEGLADVLMQWRSECAYNQPTDFLFASMQKDGKQPIWPNSAMEKHIRPAAIRAGIGKRIGWHVFRHSFGTLIKGRGADLATTKELMRHSSASVTMNHYVQAITSAKREAQRGLVGLLDPCGPMSEDRSVAST